MSYTALVVLGVCTALMVDLVILRTNLLRRKAYWVAYGILFAFQLLVNGLLTGIPIVSYRRSTILGPRFCYAPIEDLGFGFALILLTLSCWVYLGRRAARAPR